jgi:hypothetical protein
MFILFSKSKKLYVGDSSGEYKKHFLTIKLSVFRVFFTLSQPFERIDLVPLMRSKYSESLIYILLHNRVKLDLFLHITEGKTKSTLVMVM